MKRKKLFTLASAILLGLALAATACGRRKESYTLNPISESYELMDHGDNDRAIILLEGEVKKLKDSGPSRKRTEATFLLASAYMGKVGVNIFTLYDAFKDVVFNRSLSDSFWGKSGSAKNDGGSESKKVPSHPEGNDTASLLPETPASLLISRMDVALLQLKKVVTYLNRFPDIAETDWPYVDRALALLESLPYSKDVALYRAFIRVIYVRAYLTSKVIRDEKVGTRAWACGLELNTYTDGMTWMVQQASMATDDIVRVFPNRQTTLATLKGSLEGALEGVVQSERKAPPGSHTGMSQAELKIRNYFRCAEKLDAPSEFTSQSGE